MTYERMIKSGIIATQAVMVALYYIITNATCCLENGVHGGMGAGIIAIGIMMGVIVGVSQNQRWINWLGIMVKRGLSSWRKVLGWTILWLIVGDGILYLTITAMSGWSGWWKPIVIIFIIGFFSSAPAMVALANVYGYLRERRKVKVRNEKSAQQVDAAEASTIAVPPSGPSGSPR